MDAGYAHKANYRRSVSGGAVMCAGACVSFYSRAQNRLCDEGLTVV